MEQHEGPTDEQTPRVCHSTQMEMRDHEAKHESPPAYFRSDTGATNSSSVPRIEGFAVEAHGLVVLEGYTQRSRHGDVTKARGQGPKVGNDLFRCPRYRGWYRAPRHV